MSEVKKMTIDEVVEVIKGFTVIEINDLVKALEEEFGVSAAAFAMPAAGASGGGSVAEEKSEFNVILAEVGSSKMNVIKLVREVSGLGLKEAKALVDGAPGTLKENVNDAEAKEIKAKFEEIGAKIELK